MTDYTLTSAKNLPDKAMTELTRRALKAGDTNIGDLVYKQVADKHKGKKHPVTKDKIHQFTLTAS